MTRHKQRIEEKGQPAFVEDQLGTRMSSIDILPLCHILYFLRNSFVHTIIMHNNNNVSSSLETIEVIIWRINQTQKTALNDLQLDIPQQGPLSKINNIVLLF